MFGALNRFIGRLDSDSSKQPGSTTGENSYGFQVLRNTDPELPLEPWFDFIIGINGRMIDDPDPHLFATEVRNCAGSSVSLEIWSAKGQRTYTVMIPVPPEKPTLGLTLQLAPLSVTQNIWHVLSIPSPLSPAYLAGLLPHSDYILGTPSGTLRGEAALGELVEDHLNRSLTLWVYNSEFDVVREVELVPNRNWGGEGALGAVLGFGALHRLPVGLGEEVEGPGEVVFDMKGGEKNMNQPSSIPPPGGNFIVPAEMASPLPPPPKVNGQAPPQVAPPPGRHGRKHRHAHAAPVSLDDYFRESEQKSREQDFVPSQTGSPVPPPPPPKASELASAASKSPEGITSPAE